MNFKRRIAFALLVNLACVSLSLYATAAGQQRAAAASSAAQASAQQLTAARALSRAAVSSFEELAAAYRRDRSAFHATEAMTEAFALPTGDLESRSATALAAEKQRLRDVIARLEQTRTWRLPSTLR